MENNSSFAKLVYVLALIATIIGFAAFSQAPKANSFRKQSSTKGKDSTKAVRHHRNDDSRNFDKLDIELNNIDLKMDRLNEELKNIDFSKAQQQIDEAIKKLDTEKISAQINESLKKIDFAAMNKEIDAGIASIDKIDFSELKKELEKTKVNLAKQKLDLRVTIPQIDLKNININLEKTMKTARQSIEKAKEELQNFRDFTDALQKDGLIDKSKPYKIQLKDGELYINDKKQPKEVSEKYQRFYKKENFTINMNEKDDIKTDD